MGGGQGEIGRVRWVADGDFGFSPRWHVLHAEMPVIMTASKHHRIKYPAPENSACPESFSLGCPLALKLASHIRARLMSYNQTLGLEILLTYAEWRQHASVYAIIVNDLSVFPL